MDVLIPIVFPDYKISAFGKKWEDLGHAGILFILGATGTAKYYEYGRYPDEHGRNAEKGRVKKLAIPNARVDKKTGKIDRKSLTEVLRSISNQSGQSTRISGAYIDQADGYPKALKYVEAQMKLNTDPKRKEYGLFSHNCGTFMQETLEAAGVHTPWMLDPRPNSYVEELRDEFRDLDFDPKSGTLTISK